MVGKIRVVTTLAVVMLSCTGAQAGTLNRLGRILGFGWSDGYHTCPDGCRQPLCDYSVENVYNYWGMPAPNELLQSEPANNQQRRVPSVEPAAPRPSSESPNRPTTPLPTRPEGAPSKKAPEPDSLEGVTRRLPSTRLPPVRPSSRISAQPAPLLK